MKQAIRRRVLLGSTAALLPTMALGGCGYRSEYALSWDEEVLLHDGTMIVVHVTRYFWRDFQLPTFQSFYVLRDMEIAFDAGPPWGRYRRRFTGYESIELLDRKDGNWFLIILGDPGIHRLTDPRFPVWILNANGQERAATSLAELPKFPLLNILPYVGPQEEFFSFQNRLVKWEKKLSYWRAHPRAPGDTPEQLQNRSNNELNK